MTETIQYNVDSDGIATLTIDLPGTSMNVLNQQVMDELKELVGTVASDAAVKGAIITSGKPAFLAGADLKMVEHMTGVARTAGAKETFEAAYSINLLLRSIETSGKPFVCCAERPRHGRRVGTVARLPLSRRRGRSEDPARAARG